MGLHSEWKATKAKAKGVNNGKDVKFKQDTGLGSALDKFEAADKARAKKTDLGPEWAKLTDAWVAAASEVNKIAGAYVVELKDMSINDMAKKPLDNFLVFDVLNTTTKVTKEGARLEPMLKKHRK